MSIWLSYGRHVKPCQVDWRPTRDFDGIPSRNEASSLHGAAVVVVVVVVVAVAVVAVVAGVAVVAVAVVVVVVVVVVFSLNDKIL